MKIVNKKIEMIASHEANGKIMPLRFQITLEDDESLVYNVRVKSIEMIKQDREKILKFDCSIQIDERTIECELRFYIDKMIWLLYRI